MLHHADTTLYYFATLMATFKSKKKIKWKEIFMVAPCIMEFIYCSLTNICTFIKLGKV